MEPRGTGSKKSAFSNVENYEVRAGTINLGYEYEHKTVSLVTLRCLRRFEDFDDIWIAFNATSVGAMDDVVVIAKRTNDNGSINKVKIMVQLKHKEKGSDIVESQFLDTKSNGTYSLLKYYKDIINLKERLAHNSEDTCKILQHLEAVDDNTYFVLFTNKQTRKQEFLKHDGCESISFLNTSNCSENLYRIDLSKVSTVSSLPNADHNINFSLFAKQSSANHLSKIIESEIENVCRHFNLLDAVNIENISEKFVNYVTMWATGKLGGHYFLTKEDILYKLSELLLSQFEINLGREEFDFYDCPQKLLWNEFLQNKAITIVDSDEESFQFLKLYIGSEVRPYCETKRRWCDRLSTQEQSLFHEQHANLKVAMYKTVGTFGIISPLSIYKCLWFSERLPLLLQVNTLEDYDTILKILKLCNFSLKVIIINATKLILPTEEVALFCFSTLCDLSEENRLKILQCSLKLQGRSSIALDEIVDDCLFEHFSCNAIIDILLGNYNIGIEYEPLSKYFINRSFLKVFLQMDVLEHVTDEAFLIKIDKETEDSSVRNEQNIFVSTHKTRTNVIILDKTVSTRIEELKAAKVPIHRLVFHGKNLLEWKESFRSTSNIKKYRFVHLETFKKYAPTTGEPREDTNWLYSELEGSLENKIDNGLFNRMNLLSASPGMGKSTILDYIASKASTKLWVLNVDLIDHNDHYGKAEVLQAENHLKYFYDSSLKNRNCANKELSDAIFQKFVKDKRVLVMLDGLDEVPISHKDQVMKITSCLHRAGFPIWLTTRPHLTTDIEEKFGTMSITLKPFTVGDQEHFLKSYFVQVDDKINLDAEHHQTLIHEFVKRLVKANRSNLGGSYGKFMGIPLQTKMLADAFHNELKRSLQEGTVRFESNFDLLRLYEKFFEAKDVILREKLGVGAINTQELFRKHRQLFALKLLFPKRLLFRLDIEVKLKKFYKHAEAHIQNLQQDGLTEIRRNKADVNSKLQVNFIHRTFAEYTAATWLKKKINSKCDNSRWTAKILIQTELQYYQSNRFFFKLFDSMLARDCPMQMLIINGRIDEAEALATSNPEAPSAIDDGGRSFLHMIALYGVRGWKHYFRDRFEKINVTDNFGYTPLDYAIISHSYSVANDLSKISKEHSISINIRKILNVKTELKSHIFSKILLPFIICQQLLDEPNSVNQDTAISNYYHRLFEKDDYHGEDRTISDLLTRMGIRSTVEPYYYYDVQFAAAFGTPNNVLDLITSKQPLGRKYNFDNTCTPLCCAVKHNRLETVKKLLANGEKVNQPCMHKKAHTSLHCAAEMGYTDIAKELLLYQAELDALDTDGNTALIKALEYQHVGVAKLLMSNGANATLKNIWNHFPVYYATIGGWDDIIPDLSKGININYYNFSNYNTLLHVALLHGHITTAQWLLTNGADCNLLNIKGELPLHIAAKEGLHQLLPEILSKTVVVGGDVSSANIKVEGARIPFHFPSVFDKRKSVLLRNSLDTKRFLSNQNTDFNVIDVPGNTPLHYLCGKCSLDIVDRKLTLDILLKAGAAVNTQNLIDKTPLHLFIQYNSTDIAEFITLLLDNRAGVNIQDAMGDAELHFLFRNNRITANEKTISANVLISRNADVNLKNRSGQTPLHLFLQNNTTNEITEDLAAILLDSGASVNIQDAEGYAALHYLLCNNKVSTKDTKQIVNGLLLKDADVNLKNYIGQTPLHLLLQNNFQDLDIIVGILLDHGADVNGQDAEGNAALHYLFDNFNIKMEDKKAVASIILIRGADLSLKNKIDQTPLHLLMQNSSEGRDAISSILLNNGAGVNIQDIRGDSPLHYLVGNNIGSIEDIKRVANVLLNEGADVNLQNKTGQTPLHLFIQNNSEDYADIATFLINNGAGVNIPDVNEDTPLHYLFRNHKINAEIRTDIGTVLLREGVDLNLRNKNHQTPLHLFIQSNSKNLSKIVCFLIDNGAGVDLQDYHGNAALHYLFLNNRVGTEDSKHVATILVNRNADINLKNTKHQSPLHIIMQSNRKSFSNIISFLLNNEASVNTQDIYGNTAIHYLFLNRGVSPEDRQKTAALLLNKHANINLKNKIGKTPLRLFAESTLTNLSECIALLVNCQADINAQDDTGSTALHDLCTFHASYTLDRIPAVKLLLKSGADVNIKDKKGKTPLHTYLHQLNVQINSKHLSAIVPLLLNEHADVNIQDNNGNTALHYLCYNKEADRNVRQIAVKLLLTKNPDVNLTNNKGETVFHFLLQHLPSHDNSKSHFEILRILLTKGAQIDKQDKDGNTALHYLCKEWSLETEDRKAVCELLLNQLTDINLKNNLGATPLHYYMLFLFKNTNSRDLSEIVPLFLKKGTDVNMQDKHGNTALHCLCDDQRIEEDVRTTAVKLLLNKHPRVDLKNSEGISVAEHPKYIEIVSLLN